jgi:3-deoxy-manno-octulosonate cytidylyltransferase (CMP-KDO synthetase)
MPELNAKNVLAVIPARYESTRFPGKALAPIAGKPMIQHVIDRVRQARRVTRIVVATDDDRIVRSVEGFGGQAVLTRRDHRSGTERIAEVAAQIEAAIYVDVQGDEPLIDAETIDSVVASMLEDDAVQLATPCTAITRAAEIMDPNIVKVVFDFEGNALYFSRAPVPWVREADAPVAAQHRKHIGVYAFRRDALLDYPTLPPGDLERVEGLEQLRWLENGYRIRVVESSYNAVSVDVPADVARVEELLKGRGVLNHA